MSTLTCKDRIDYCLASLFKKEGCILKNRWICSLQCVIWVFAFSRVLLFFNDHLIPVLFLYSVGLFLAWSILPRSNPPLKSAGDFPQIVSNRITRVKPINIGFLNRFYVFSIAGFWSILSNKIIRLTISRG